MKRQNLIAVVGAAVLLSACIPSVNPFYTDKDVVFAYRLLGEWREKDSKGEPQGWKFEKAGDNVYTLMVTEEENKQGKFSAHLFKLKDNHFLDLIPTDCEYATNQADLVAFSMFRGHLLFRVFQFEPELKLASCNYKWLEAYLKKNPAVLAHRKDDGIVLTAETRALQRFVLHHLADGELFDTPVFMVRKTNNVPASAP